MTYAPEHIQEKRRKLRSFLTPRELRSKIARNPITRASIIAKYHQLHYDEHYPFKVYENLIMPERIVEIITQ